MATVRPAQQPSDARVTFGRVRRMESGAQRYEIFISVDSGRAQAALGSLGDVRLPVGKNVRLSYDHIREAGGFVISTRSVNMPYVPAEWIDAAEDVARQLKHILMAETRPKAERRSGRYYLKRPVRE